MDFFAQVKRWRNEDKAEFFEAPHGVPSAFWEAYSSFANSDGGYIVLGVSEASDGSLSVTGVNDPHGLSEEIWSSSNNSARVSKNILYKDGIRTEEVQGSSVLVVSVPRAPRNLRPIYVRNSPRAGVYRRNEGIYRCTEEEYDSLVRDTSNFSINSELLSDFGLDVVSRDTLDSYRESMNKAYPGHPWSTVGSDEFLVLSGAAARDNSGSVCPTKAGLLFLGTDEAISEVFRNFSLEFRTVLSRRRWDWRLASGDGSWSGNLFDFWVRSTERLSKDLHHLFPELGDGEDPAFLSLYHACSEGLLNALIHADYEAPGGVSVILKKEALTISNPGVSRVSPSVFEAGGVSDVRNEVVASLLGLSGVDRTVGRGFSIMASTCKSLGYPPPALSCSFGPDRTTLVMRLNSSPGVERVWSQQDSGEPSVYPYDSGENTWGDRPRPDPLGDSPSVGVAAGVNSSNRSAPSWFSREPIDGPSMLPADRVASRPPQASSQAHSVPPSPASFVAPQAVSEPPEPPAEPQNVVPNMEIYDGYEGQVLSLISEKGFVRRKDVEALLGLGSSRTKVILAGMVDMGLIRMTGSGRSTAYRAV